MFTRYWVKKKKHFWMLKLNGCWWKSEMKTTFFLLLTKKKNKHKKQKKARIFHHFFFVALAHFSVDTMPIIILNVPTTKLLSSHIEMYPYENTVMYDFFFIALFSPILYDYCCCFLLIVTTKSDFYKNSLILFNNQNSR